MINDQEVSTLTSNYYDSIYEFAKELINSFDESMTPVYKMTKSLKSIYEPLENTMKVFNSEMTCVEIETNKMQKMIRGLDIQKMLAVSEKIKTLPSIDISGISNSLKQVADTKLLLKSYDFVKLSKIIRDSLGQIDWKQDVSVEEITEEVAEQYIEEELVGETNANNPNVQNVQLDKRQMKKDIKGIISFWVDIIGVVISIYGIVNSKQTVVYNTYNNITEVNNNYTVDIGINAELMNNLGYRIINQNNVMPRIKPDCSSTVTGHLYIGQVVHVLDKQKKWIEVIWKNDDGNYCSGWIQNYKVSKFK